MDETKRHLTERENYLQIIIEKKKKKNHSNGKGHLDLILMEVPWAPYRAECTSGDGDS